MNDGARKAGLIGTAAAALGLVGCASVIGPKLDGDGYDGRLAEAAARQVSPAMPTNRVAAINALGALGSQPFDANGDGKLQFGEWTEQAFARYLLFDADNDRRLSPDEFVESAPSDTPALKKSWHDLFARLDADGDGYLQTMDIAKQEGPAFRARDLNHDGAVTAQEIRRYNEDAARRNTPSPFEQAAEVMILGGVGAPFLALMWLSSGRRDHPP